MQIVDLPLPGLKMLRPRVFRDERGFFIESHRDDLLKGAGITVPFVQDNHSRSLKNTIRGMHFQTTPGQDKLIRVARGAIFDVAVDIRPDSPTFGRWHGEVLDDEKLEMMFVPVGFAHGFCVISDVADVLYKCSAVFDPKTEAGFLLDDAEVGVRWPIDIAHAIRSKRDLEAPTFAATKQRLLGTSTGASS